MSSLPLPLVILGIAILAVCLYILYWWIRYLVIPSHRASLDKLDSNLNQEEDADGSWQTTDEELAEPLKKEENKDSD